TEQPGALGRQRLEAAQPLARLGEGEDGVARLAHLLRLRRRLGLEPGQRGTGLGQRGLGLRLALPQRALVGALLLELGRELREVVREQTRLRVTQVALHGLRLARRLGLPAERSELAAQLRGEVAQARQVALHRVELAQRLLLALAVLEDACGLLDEAAALLRRGAQDGVELALADHDVHLAPDAGVAEQLLDVEQAARVAVDGVLGAAAAEQRARDRHLGVVDRQRAVGVVDRQRDLGTTERGT